MSVLFYAIRLFVKKYLVKISPNISTLMLRDRNKYSLSIIAILCFQEKIDILSSYVFNLFITKRVF